MSDIFLHKYNSEEVENLSGYNSPHKYRFARKKNQEEYSNLCIICWNTYKVKILNELVNKIKEEIDTNKQFSFAIAPSRTEPFNNDIRIAIENGFPNAIDLSDCFSKREGVEMIGITDTLTDSQLREIYTFDKTNCDTFIDKGIKIILLVDDIYATGNTLRGMYILVKDIFPDIEIKTAVILKTT